MDIIVSAGALRAFMERAFAAEGFGVQDAQRIADVLMLADLFGIESHGAQRMMYYHQNIKSGSVNVIPQSSAVMTVCGKRRHSVRTKSSGMRPVTAQHVQPSSLLVAMSGRSDRRAAMRVLLHACCAKLRLNTLTNLILCSIFIFLKLTIIPVLYRTIITCNTAINLCHLATLRTCLLLSCKIAMLLTDRISR